MEHPTVCVSFIWQPPPHVFPKLLQDVAAELHIDSLTLRNKFFVDNPVSVKKSHQLWLYIAFDLPYFFQSGWRFPLRWLLFHFRVMPTNQIFIISYDLEKEVLVISALTSSFSTNFAAIYLMYSSSDKMLWHILYDSCTILQMSHTVLLWASRIALQTLPTFFLSMKWLKVTQDVHWCSVLCGHFHLFKPFLSLCLTQSLITKCL